MLAVTRRLEGAFSLLAVTPLAPGVIVAARRSSPLVIGLGEGESFLGSDVAAFVAFTKRAAEVDDDQVLRITADEVTVWDADGTVVEPRTWEVSWDASAAVKGGHETFMDKEIHEQPTAVADTLRGRVDEKGELVLDEMRIDPAVLRSVDKIIVIACGTAFYAGQIGRYAFERIAGLPCDVEIASEFRYRSPAVGAGTLALAVSQSGETPAGDDPQSLARAAEFYKDQLRKAPRAVAYLKGRGLTGEIAARFAFLQAFFAHPLGDDADDRFLGRTEFRGVRLLDTGRAGALGDRIRHLLDMAVGRVIENQNLGHEGLLEGNVGLEGRTRG